MRKHEGSEKRRRVLISLGFEVGSLDAVLIFDFFGAIAKLILGIVVHKVQKRQHGDRAVAISERARISVADGLEKLFL